MLIKDLSHFFCNFTKSCVLFLYLCILKTNKLEYGNNTVQKEWQ